MESIRYSNQKVISMFFLSFSLVLITAAFVAQPAGEVFSGFGSILTSSQVLTVDACVVGGLGGALFNTGVLGVIAWALLHFSGAELGGVSIGAFFLTMGFSFFGKNCLNVWPIFLGTWLYARLKKQPFGKFANMALFACSLTPFVSEALFNRQLDYSLFLGVFLALLVGVVIGLIFPALAAHTAAFHKGHNLFNAGVAGGFLALAFFGVYKTAVLRPLGLETEYALNSILSDGFPLFFAVLLGAIFVVTIIVGYLLSGKSFEGYLNLLTRTGHGNDYTVLDGMGSVLINFGILGVMGLAYFGLVRAPFSGPTMGSLLCILCWAGNGSHVRNVLPIMLGYVLVSFVATWSLGTQAIAVAICFATGMSPISGRWGWQWGVVAGALHASLASYTAAIHGGFNIYNGGFTSGLTALVLVPVLESFFREVSAKKAQAPVGRVKAS